MIEPQIFKNQKDLLKWLKSGGVKWTRKQLSENLPGFSTDWNGDHIHITRTGAREYFVSNY